MMSTAVAGRHGWSGSLAIPFGVACGLGIGLLNGIGVAYLRVPSMIFTLATNAIAQGAMVVHTSGFAPQDQATPAMRLLADTGALPQGKLEAVRLECERTGKPFEYAFLLDALTDEQDQGITIDTARCFFKSATRDYIIIDAPGHIEFLKNMISGAARAEAAVLVIDAKEGVRENSRRHVEDLSPSVIDGGASEGRADEADREIDRACNKASARGEESNAGNCSQRSIPVCW
jgi:hypothetical protein